MSEKKRWFGNWPAKCDLCGRDLSYKKYFVDGSTSEGWALMCPICHKHYGQGLGIGRGQKYDSSTLEKLEG